MIGYRKSVQFVYNPNNELKQTITITDTGLEVQRTTTNYFYDAFGRRIAKNSQVERLHKLNQRGELVRYPTALMHLRKTDKTTYQSTLMLWEGNRQIQEYTDDFVFTTVYDQDSFEAVARVVQVRNSSNKQPHSSDDGRLNNADNAELFKVYHYHNNHLGTPQELTDQDGNVIWANYEYAWGGSYQRYYKEQSLNGIAIQDYELQPLKFQGQSLDIETGLHYNRFRYYDSDVGMFIQRDPIGLLGGWNVFAYAPNPVGWVDPWGLSAQGGGSYGLTRKQSTAGQVNHMPAHNSIQKSGLSITHYSAPATWMSTADHLKTASWGNSTTAKKWRAVQSDLLARGKFGKAMEMDIKDIQRKFGSTYNVGMSEMVDYAKEQGYIDNREARRLKRKYRLCH